MRGSTATKQGDHIRVDYAYNPKNIRVIESIPGYKLRSLAQDKYWLVPLTADNIDKLEIAGFTLASELYASVEDRSKQYVVTPGPLTLASLGGSLRPFQDYGVRWLNSRGGRALLADDMGLGKTIEALAWLEANPKALPAVVVCPEGVKLHWRNKALEWISLFEDQVEVVFGRKRSPIHGLLAIINYEILNDRLEDLMDFNPATVIVDECHLVRNISAARTKAAQDLCYGSDYVIGLSGTPIVNRPYEMWTMIEAIDPKLFTWKEYGELYCDRKWRKGKWDLTGSSNTKLLHEKLVSTIMLRRTKEEVLDDLPPKQRIVIPITMDKAAYRKAEQGFFAWVKGCKEMKATKTAFGQVEKLKQATVAAKLDACLNWIADFIDVAGKLVVFSTHTKVVESILSEFGRAAVRYDGKTSNTNKAKAIKRFVEDPSCKIFDANLISGGTGIDRLQEVCSSTCHIEYGWSPMDHDQGEDRVYRMGQEADSVFAYYLTAEGSIEDDIMEVLDRKRVIVKAVLTGQDATEEELLLELLNRYKEKAV